ncbi:uncharacterized protein VDAG_04491 [Verticillium dahliae VdLs.17]|uniref:Secreted protein n=1 Tax=Verticillium dahliae (strain VdLs.17 / ATCC MYA-4575 / FGSC 10137) TaxID=498257 RepID=G2X2G7_VERDV|nr:uncharacterized protein VDAG_04491 [Verticillium dahliae VdLs.17]EGY23053.1 hypothetical protein VDAG_04491 [Verticillium dahliae VdLs.17]
MMVFLARVVLATRQSVAIFSPTDDDESVTERKGRGVPLHTACCCRISLPVSSFALGSLFCGQSKFSSQLTTLCSSHFVLSSCCFLPFVEGFSPVVCSHPPIVVLDCCLWFAFADRQREYPTRTGEKNVSTTSETPLIL